MAAIAQSKLKSSSISSSGSPDVAATRLAAAGAGGARAGGSSSSHTSRLLAGAAASALGYAAGGGGSSKSSSAYSSSSTDFRSSLTASTSLSSVKYYPLSPTLATAIQEVILVVILRHFVLFLLLALEPALRGRCWLLCHMMPSRVYFGHRRCMRRGRSLRKPLLLRAAIIVIRHALRRMPGQPCSQLTRILLAPRWLLPGLL